jgi:hypothetical protein
VPPLEWLDQIRAHIWELQRKIVEDQGHLGSLHAILEGRSEALQPTSEILLEDQAELTGHSGPAYTLDQQPGLLDTRWLPASRNAAREHAQTCGGLPSQ